MKDKTIVVTMYGKKETVESISVSLIDNDPYSSRNSAIEYCNNINDLELKDDNWVYASIAGENEKIILKIPPDFVTIINQLDDLSLMKILREVDKKDLAIALKDADEKTTEKIFRNISKRAATMLKEDIEQRWQGASKDNIKSSQNKIIKVVQHWEANGEIVVIARATADE
jgi:flagellar motor switch protein FliG